MSANQKPPLDPQLRAQLERAEQLQAAGRPQEAAPLLAEAARQLEASNPRRAANVHAGAAFAYADRGDNAAALAQARIALGQFATLGMNDRTATFYGNITHKLRGRSWTASAEALEREFGGQVRGGGAAPPGGLSEIAEANRLFASGQPRRAGALLTQVAERLEAGQPRRAANLHAGAAQAFADGGGEAGALAQARAALNGFLQLEMAGRAATFYANITRKLRGRGLASTADLLQHEFEGRVSGAAAAAPAAAASPKRGRLPAACPTCGGPARSDEVEWIDDASAACIYCGGVLQAEDRMTG